MGIRISEINAKNLGPIAHIEWKLGTVNLVYGKNESGKTHLVEFLIRSLFKTMSYPGLRLAQVNGQVIVTGLSDQPVPFNPATKKKLEEYLASSNQALPANISRLLVVRAGELSLVDSHQEGISKNILDDYLSDTGLIKAIQDKIPNTLRTATIANGVINGNYVNPIKDHRLRKAEIGTLDALIGRVSAEYSSGLRGACQKDLNAAREQLAAELQAKCHLAYTLDQAIHALEQQLAGFPAETLKRADEELAEYQLKTDTLQKLVESRQAKAAEGAHFPWLETALNDYTALTTGSQGAPGIWLAVLAGLCLAGAAVLALIRQPYSAITLMAVAAALGYAQIARLGRYSRRAAQNAEVARIAAGFQSRFNLPLTDVSTLRLALETQKAASIEARALAGQVEEKQAELARLEQALSDSLYTLAGERLPHAAWSGKLIEISQQVEDLKQRLAEHRLQFAALQVESADFQPAPAAGSYDDHRCKALLGQVSLLEGQLRDEDTRLTALRGILSQAAGLSISEAWEKLIDRLYEKRADAARAYQEVTASLLAGVVVNGVLEALKKEEEKSIHAGLTDRYLTGYLKQMTTHYQQVELENGSIQVADAFAHYPFSELSTAAQEQVLLALRLGFSSRCFAGQNLFMVLDDAFQHSDWDRRAALVDGILQVAKNGWQILYLTMDDQIRDLFRAKMEPLFPGDCRYWELSREG